MASNNNFPVSFRTQDWASMVIEQWGPLWRAPDIAYEFKNDRKFESTDQYTSGIYKRT